MENTIFKSEEQIAKEFEAREEFIEELFEKENENVIIINH